MFAYHVRMALKSIRRNFVLSLLMVAAIGIGIGACMTVITVYYMMSGDPIPQKSDQLFAVQLNHWGPGPYDEDRPERLPELVTYTDAMNLLQSEIPVRQAAMYESAATIDPDDPEVNPLLATIRFTNGDFFPMFDVPFLYGGAWDESADRNADAVVVLNRSINEEVFGGENSVGRMLTLDNRQFRVLGVLDTWEPVPRFYSAYNDEFGETADLFIPRSVNNTWQLQTFGNVNCWGEVEINSFEDFLASDCVWLEYWAELPDEDSRAEYTSWLSGYVAEQKKLGRFPLENAKAEIRDVNAWLEYNEVVSADFRILLGLAFMFLAVCLLNTVALLLAKFSGNAPRVGLRRALGASKAVIFRQNLVEVSIIGVAGGTFGLFLAWLGLLGVKAVNMGRYDQLVSMDLTLVAIAFLISLVSALVAGLYPTWRVCQVPPATYLKTQ